MHFTKDDEMKQEIKLGGLKFVVDDPNGTLTRVQPQERTPEHQDCAPVQVTVKEARERREQEQAIVSTYHPMGAAHSRVMALDALAKGRSMGVSGWIIGWGIVAPICVVILAAIAYGEFRLLRSTPGITWQAFGAVVMLLFPAIIVLMILDWLVSTTAKRLRKRKAD